MASGRAIRPNNGSERCAGIAVGRTTSMIDWLLTVLRLLPRDPDRTAQRFSRASAAAGDRLRPWLYGLIAAAVVLLLVVLLILAVVR